jgi:hypothetical protein
MKKTSDSWSQRYIRQLKSVAKREEDNKGSRSEIQESKTSPANEYSIPGEDEKDDEKHLSDVNMPVNDLDQQDEYCVSTELDKPGDDDDFSIKAIYSDDSHGNIPFHTDRLPKPPFRLLLVAQSHSGKTTCIVNMITHKNMYSKYFEDRIHIFSRNILNDPTFMVLSGEILSNSWDGYLPSILQQVYDNQKKIVETEGKRKDNTRLIILDDVISDVYSRNKPGVLSTMFMMCRHVNISIILTSQQYKLIPKPIRVNCSSLILFRIHNNEELRNIFNEHGGILSYKQFEIILSHCWKGRYDFLYCELANSTPAFRFRRNFDKPMNVMNMLMKDKKVYRY